MELLLVTSRPEMWRDCLPILQGGDFTLKEVSSLEEAKALIKATPPVLVILDQLPDDKALRQAVIDIMMIDASVHTAVVSDMAPEAFHEATEGLGILMPLPSSPSAEDARRLLKTLSGVM